MLILGLNGSPNKEGNTKHLLTNLLEEIEVMGISTDILDVYELVASTRNGFCIACSNPCTKACYKGSKLEEAFELMKKADGIIFGSPVYFGTISAQLKAMFDMSRVLRGEKAFYNKIAAGVTVGASNFGGQETTIKALHDIMLVHGMIIVGDGYFDDDCGHHGVCAVKPAENDDFALKRGRILAKRMVEVCRETVGLRSNA